MTPPDETLAWTDAQIEFEIARHIPDNAEFVCEWLENLWSARVERRVESDVHVVVASEHFDRRMVLYDVYGLLWLQAQPRPTRPSIWDPTTARPTVASVSSYVQSRVEDPEDLDPKEVAAVYGIRSPQSKRN